MSDLVLGIDVGTSGVRVAAVDQAAWLVAFAASTMPAAHRDHDRITQDAAACSRGLDDAMTRLASMVDLARVGALAVDGTSGTLVAVDDRGNPVTAGSLYNDRADDASIAVVERAAPAHAAVRGAASPLARAMRLLQAGGVAKILHQADWVAGQFSGRFDISDESNSLKTGYDPVARAWRTGSRPSTSNLAGICRRWFRPAPSSARCLPRRRTDLAYRPGLSLSPARRMDARLSLRPAPASRETPSPRWARRWF